MASNSNIVVADGKEKLSLPFGHRFCPRNHHLMYYLKQKILGRKLPADIIPTVPDLYGLNPDKVRSIPSSEQTYAEEDTELGLSRQWIFFTTIKVEEDGDIRTAEDGYWDFVESPIPVEDPQTGATLGFKHSLHFYKGIFPDGIECDWAIYEYRLNLDTLLQQEDGKINDETKHKVKTFVACRLVKLERHEWITEESDSDDDEQD